MDLSNRQENKSPLESDCQRECKRGKDEEIPQELTNDSEEFYSNKIGAKSQTSSDSESDSRLTTHGSITNKSCISSPLAMLEKTCQNIGMNEIMLNGKSNSGGVQAGAPSISNNFQQKENINSSCSKEGFRVSRTSPPSISSLKRSACETSNGFLNGIPTKHHRAADGLELFRKNLASITSNAIRKEPVNLKFLNPMTEMVTNQRSNSNSSNALAALSRLSQSFALNATPKAPTLTMMPGVSIQRKPNNTQNGKTKIPYNHLINTSNIFKSSNGSATPLKVQTSQMEPASSEKMQEILRFVDEMSTTNDPQSMLYMMLMKSLVEAPTQNQISPSPPLSTSPTKPTAVVNPACSRMTHQGFPKRNAQGQPIPCHCMYCGRFCPNLTDLMMHIYSHFGNAESPQHVAESTARMNKELSKQDNVLQNFLNSENLQALLAHGFTDSQNEFVQEEPSQTSQSPVETNKNINDLATYMELIYQYQKATQKSTSDVSRKGEEDEHDAETQNQFVNGSNFLDLVGCMLSLIGPQSSPISWLLQNATTS